MDKQIYIMIFQGFLFLIYGGMKILKNTFLSKDVFFGYSVDKHLSKEEKDGYKKRYLKESGLVGLVAGALLILLPYLLKSRGLFIISNIIYILVYEVLDIRWAKLLKEDPKMKSRTDIYLKDGKLDQTISYWYFLMPVFIILFNMIFGLILYKQIPEKLPVNWTVDGNMSGEAVKTFKNIFLIPMFQFYLTLVIFGIFVYLKKSKRLINPMYKSKSEKREIIFRRLWSIYLVIALTLTLSSFTVLNMMTLKLYEDMILFNTINAITIWLILVYGIQLILLLGGGGDNLVMDEDNRDLKSEDYKFWKLENKIYINPRNKNLFVENKNKNGLVLNLGRPVGIVLAITPLLIIGISMYMNL